MQMAVYNVFKVKTGKYIPCSHVNEMPWCRLSGSMLFNFPSRGEIIVGIYIKVRKAPLSRWRLNRLFIQCWTPSVGKKHACHWLKLDEIYTNGSYGGVWGPGILWLGASLAVTRVLCYLGGFLLIGIQRQPRGLGVMFHNDIGGLAQGCGNSSASALELPQSCTKPSRRSYDCLFSTM